MATESWWNMEPYSLVAQKCHKTPCMETDVTVTSKQIPVEFTVTKMLFSPLQNLRSKALWAVPCSISTAYAKATSRLSILWIHTANDVFVYVAVRLSKTYELIFQLHQIQQARKVSFPPAFVFVCYLRRDRYLYSAIPTPAKNAMPKPAFTQENERPSWIFRKWLKREIHTNFSYIVKQ